MNGVDQLCFGTSTFVAGRLRPGKDSAPGITALQAAVAAGVRLVHSNPRLGTQWAIRRALAATDDAGAVRHLIKAEAPLDADPATLRAHITRAIEESCVNLEVDQIHAVTMEIDLKRTRDLRKLADEGAVQGFYASAVNIATQSRRVTRVIGYCHSPAHLAAVLRDRQVHGVAAQFNLAEPWPALYFGAISDAGLPFVGIAPLRRGALASTVVSGDASERPLSALRWAAADARVSAIVLTMSTLVHVHQAIDVVHQPLPTSSVHELARRWRNEVYPVRAASVAQQNPLATSR